MSNSMEALKEQLKKLAAQECLSDDLENFNPQDASGGNFDDSYYRGCDDGETLLARELLETFFNEQPVDKPNE